MSFQVYNDENTGVQTRAKRADIQQAAQKRTVLGQVTNVRQQPARAAKSQTVSNTFKVYEDENLSAAVKDEGKKVKTTRRAPAPAPVWSPPQGLSEKPIVDTPAESPMLLDVSCMDTEDAKVAAPPTRGRNDRDTLLHCLPEYQDDIHSYLLEAENNFRPKLNYMRKQSDISPQMRTILVDWLVEVGEEYKLHNETLYLAVNYIDRFLSQMSVLRGKLQLVGTACMFIASKYEEIYPPDVGEFVYITDDTYTKRQLLRMEHLVIKVLSFGVAVPTANVFADLYFHQLDCGDVLRNMVQYIMELSLLDCENYLQYKPSMIASASLFLAVHLCQSDQMRPVAAEELEEITRYQRVQLGSLIQKLHQTLKTAHEQPQQAVREKYKADSRRAVALRPVPEFL